MTVIVKLSEYRDERRPALKKPSVNEGFAEGMATGSTDCDRQLSAAQIYDLEHHRRLKALHTHLEAGRHTERGRAPDRCVAHDRLPMERSRPPVVPAPFLHCLLLHCIQQCLRECCLSADPDLTRLVVWLDIAGELRRHVTSHIKIDLRFALHFTLD